MNRFDEQEIEAVNQVIRSGKLSRFFTDFNGGEQVQAFEQEFAAYLGTKHAISVSNGTVALEVALASLGLKKGDEVITTPLTFIATATSILRTGAKPVFVDIDLDTLNMNEKIVEGAITQKTKAILSVSLLGKPARMSFLRTIADDYELDLVEDAAQSLGAEYGGRKIGTHGRLGTFSFQESKTITSLDWHEPIVVLSPLKELQIRNIGDFVENEKWTGWQCVAFDQNLKLHFVPITGVYRHPVDEELYEVTLENGRKTKVSASHSLFIIENGKILDKPVSQLITGDFCCVPLLLPHIPIITEINLLSEFLKLPDIETKNLFYRGQKLISLKSCWKTKKPSYPFNVLRSTIPIHPSNEAEIGNKSFKIKAILKITPELCRLIGYYLAEGNWNSASAQLTFGHSDKEKSLASDAQNCIKTLGIKARIYYEPTKTTVVFGQKYLRLIFKEIFKTGTNAFDKHIPSFLFRVSDDLKKEFINAYFAGDGHIEYRLKKSQCSYLVCTVSSNILKELPFLLLTMKSLPSIEYMTASIRNFPQYQSECAPAFKIGVRGIGQVNKLLKTEFSDFSSKPQIVECIPTNHAGLKKLIRNNCSTRKNGYRTVFEKERITRRTLSKMRLILPENTWLLKLQESEIGFAKIKKIRKVEPTANYVYDLCVEGYENFVGGIGGICLHNTLGEGGMIVTDDDDLADLCRHIRNHGNTYGNRVMNLPCTNARLTEIQAAFGRVQLNKLDAFIKVQRDNATALFNNLSRFFDPSLHPSFSLSPPYTAMDSVYYLIPFYIAGCSQKDFIKKCVELGISQGLPGQNIGYYKKLVYENYVFGKPAKNYCPQANYIKDDLLLFDIHRWNKTPDDMKTYAEAIATFLSTQTLKKTA